MSLINYLHIIPFSNVANWSVQYLLDTSHSYNEKFSFVKIGKILIRNKTGIDIEDGKQYKRVTIRGNNNGIVQRDIEKGENIGTKKQFVIKEGQFLVSKIDARNGAFGVIPKNLDNAIITGNFWTFDIDYSIINPSFLTLITTTPTFIKFCENASNGTTNRHYLQEKLFLEQEIPLPSLDKQNEIIANYDNKVRLAKQQQEDVEKLELEIEKYMFNELGISEQNDYEIKSGLCFISYSKLSKWALSHLNKDNIYNFEDSKYKVEKIKNLLVFLEGGKTPSKGRNDYWTAGEIYWTSAKDFSGQYLNDAQDKITLLAVKDANMKVYPKGVFLSVFRSGILQHSFPTVLTTIETTINQDVKAYQFNDKLIDKLYYLNFVHIFKKYFLLKASKKSVTVESINTEDFLEINIPLPPIEKQKEISEHINRIKMKISELKALSDKNKFDAIVEFGNEIFN